MRRREFLKSAGFGAALTAVVVAAATVTQSRDRQRVELTSEDSRQDDVGYGAAPYGQAAYGK